MPGEASLQEFLPEILSIFFDTYPHPVLIGPQDGGMVKSNRAAEKLLGLTSEEFSQLPPFSLFPDHVTDNLPSLLQKEQKGGGLTFTVPIRTRSGEFLTVELCTKLFRYRNMTFRTSILRPLPGLDTTEASVPDAESFPASPFRPDILKEPEMVFEIDLAGYITMANSLCLDKTGFTRNDIRKGLRFTQLLTAEETARGIEDFERLLGNEDLSSLDYTVRCKDGSTFPVMVSLKRVMDDDSLTGIRGVALDISEHKRIEQNLLIKEKLNILGELAGGVVHNFNNILTVILGYIDLFPMETANEPSREILRKIRRAASDGAEIVKRIQNFSQLQESTERQISDMNEVIRDVLEFVKPKLSAAPGPITVNMRLETVPPVVVLPFELREVLSNIILNSIDAMPSGGLITITTGLRAGSVLVTIDDTGIGMSEGTKQRVFEPFFTTKKNRGTGIGMSVSYAIINKNGGDILIDSEEGIGTTVTIMLPVADIANCSKEKKDSGAGPPPSRKILVIDDEENICDILGEYLTRQGHHVMTAHNGEKGLEILDTSSFDIVITDLNMPRVSGWDIAHRIKKLSPETFTIMLTGWGTSIDELNRRKNVVDRLIFKPINFSTLSGIIAEMVAVK
jgi:PAS domain S-box-containing protein